MKLTYKDYAIWAEAHPIPSCTIWAQWDGKIVTPDFGHRAYTQDELLNLHFDRWLEQGREVNTGVSLLAYFESLNYSEYDDAVQILGEDYFA
jgi:hypothetical protein